MTARRGSPRWMGSSSHRRPILEGRAASTPVAAEAPGGLRLQTWARDRSARIAADCSSSASRTRVATGSSRSPARRPWTSSRRSAAASASGT
jgi:hypothetical protein